MIAQLLIMMMQGAHEENPSTLSVFLFCILEISHLDTDAQHFYQEYAAEDRDQ
jgi:hypothetical protein